MSATGVIVNGRVELDEPGAFPEGMRVRIDPEQERPMCYHQIRR